MNVNAFLVAVVLVAIAAFAGYRWYQAGRTARIKKWVRSFLSDRYGRVPHPLSIQCTDDTRWPILVGFRTDNNQIRHRLQFICPGARHTFALVSEIKE